MIWQAINIFVTEFAIFKPCLENHLFLNPKDTFKKEILIFAKQSGSISKILLSSLRLVY